MGMVLMPTWDNTWTFYVEVQGQPVPPVPPTSPQPPRTDNTKWLLLILAIILSVGAIMRRKYHA